VKTEDEIPEIPWGGGEGGGIVLFFLLHRSVTDSAFLRES
jgi:hypothetical protein